ncbi:hypothetical protein HZC21_04575 [Candidatus Peregrinibacteria bacterium]|nr:hypothetical protein [Candidatus Peregrinibacteria bacterium]
MDFFAELEKLRRTQPRISAIRLNNTNSDYTANTDQCKNCYLIANAVHNEDCMYGRDFHDNSDCSDCDHIFGCTLCYECENCKQCWDSIHLQDSNNCQNCSYGYDLKDCRNCIGCVGLRKKEFHIFNMSYSKEDFFCKKASLKRHEIQAQFNELKLKIPRTYSLQIATENCFGDNIYNCKNIWYSFDVHECQDCGYIEECKQLHDCWDNTILEESQFCYQISSSHILNNCNFCFQCLSSNDCEFCEFVMNSRNCFGCISLNRKEYHILNRPYPKEEYFKRVSEIKTELRRERDYGGKFWSPTFPFEDTVAAWKKL